MRPARTHARPATVAAAARPAAETRVAGPGHSAASERSNAGWTAFALGTEGNSTGALGGGASSANDSVRRAIETPGRPLHKALRRRMEGQFDASLGGVSVHTDARAAEAARALRARAFALGPHIVFGAGEFAPGTLRGRHLLAHELAHVVQQQRSSGAPAPARSSSEPAPPTLHVSQRGDRSEREAEQAATAIDSGRAPPRLSALGAPALQRDDDSGAGFCEPTHGTFVLDPAIAGARTPPMLETHVLVNGAPGAAPNYVQLERPVLSARRLSVQAVRHDALFATGMEAWSTRPMVSTEPPPDFLPGETAWTASGEVTVIDTVEPYVLVEQAIAETVGAAVVIVLETDGGPVLIDAGMQLTEAGAAAVLGQAMREQLLQATGGAAIAEAILSPAAPSGHLLPMLAERLQIRSVRATLAQVDDGTLGRVLQAQSEFRAWFERSLRECLESGRVEWERMQPISVNEGMREQRWQAHVQAELDAARDDVNAPTVLMARAGAGLLDLGAAVSAPPSEGGIPDLTDSTWEDAADEQVIVYGEGRITLFPARGFVLRPVPSATSVPELRPTGTVGPAAATPRAVSPWMAISAVGKEAQMLVRLAQGEAVLVDAGGSPRAVAVSALAEMQARLGVSSVERILVTHAHTDHVRHLVELIVDHGIRAENLVVSDAWNDTEILRELRGTRGPHAARLQALGYGSDFRPSVAVAATGVTHLRVATGPRGSVDIYARGAAHARLAAGLAASRRGGAAPASTAYDSASFLYVYGNPDSPARTAVLGDFRGADIVAMQADLGAPAFARALANVRVVYGLGHHFSETAGRTPTDIRGMDLLLEQTLMRNGELTILIQSRESFAFGSANATTAGPEGALLRYLLRQGVRVVFAGRAPDASRRAGGATAGAVVDTAGGVSTYGPGGVSVLAGADPRVTAMHQRLEMLREALRTVIRSNEFGPAALDQPGIGAAELIRTLEIDIARLQALAGELRGLAGADLLDARGSGHVADSTREDFRSARNPTGRTEAQILADAEQTGAAERALSDAVRARLRLALASGRPLDLALEFAATPANVLAVIETLPEAQRSSLGARYRELAALTQALDSDNVPATRRAEFLLRARALRDELRTAVEAQGGAAADARLGNELRRLDTVVERLSAEGDSRIETGRDLDGRNTRTEYLRFLGPDPVAGAFHVVGRGMGALMVVHSIEELGTAAGGMASGDMNLPESALRASHAAYGLSIGVRLARATVNPARTLVSGNVHPAEFVAMAVLEIGAAAVADHANAEDRNEAILGTAIHSTVNLLCLAAGQAIMTAGTRVPHPLGRLGVMGLGFAVMMAGESILEFFGLDDNVQRWTSFPPGSVTHVHQRIGAVLDGYRVLIGTRSLAARSDDELRALHVGDPAALREDAGAEADSTAQGLSALENELTGLFESAYADSRGAWVGLQVLDQQAAEFSRLRHAAMEGRADPGREALDARWREIDRSLQLSDASADTIRGMSQWRELDERLGKLAASLSATAPDHDDIFEHMDRAEMMIENARYRMDPASRGGLRPVPLLPEGSAAREVYRLELQPREQALAVQLGRLAALGNSGYVAPSAPALGALGVGAPLPTDAVDPRSAYARLRAVRQSYTTVVARARAQLPALDSPQTWAEPATLTRLVEQANREHGDLFRHLRASESALRNTAQQAQSALALVRPDTICHVDPAHGSQPPEELRRLIAAEVAAASHAMHQRLQHGLIFMHEIDSVIEQRGALEDRHFSTLIDAYTDPTSTGATRPLDENESLALRRDRLGSSGAGTASTEARLAEFRRIMAPVRTTDGSTMDYNQMSRLVDRQYATLANPYRTYDDGYIYDSFPQHSYDSALRPLVAVVAGGRFGASDNGLLSTPMIYQRVLAINGDAVRVLGNSPVEVRIIDLQGIPSDEIVAGAARAAP